MENQNPHITKQFKLLKLTKHLVVCLLGLVFALEFALLNLISIHKEKKVVISYEGVGQELVAVQDTIVVGINQELQELIEFIKKKHEEQNHNNTDSKQLTAFNLFFSEHSRFRLSPFPVISQTLNGFYREPYRRQVPKDIFHPPKFWFV